MQLLKIYKLAEKRNGNTVHADPSVLQGESAIRSLVMEARATSAIEGEHLSYGDLHSVATSLLKTGRPVDRNIDERATGVVQMLIASRGNICRYNQPGPQSNRYNQYGKTDGFYPLQDE